MIKRGAGVRRNDRCICGSGKKFKYCCSHGAVLQPAADVQKTQYADTGESPVRYVITDSKGTSFFSTKDGQIIVFQTRSDAIEIATLDVFSGVEAGEINVAGVGVTKWKRLQTLLPFVEVSSAEEAAALVHERMSHRQTQLESETGVATPATESPANPETA